MHRFIIILTVLLLAGISGVGIAHAAIADIGLQELFNTDRSIFVVFEDGSGAACLSEDPTYCIDFCIRWQPCDNFPGQHPILLPVEGQPAEDPTPTPVPDEEYIPLKALYLPTLTK